MKQLRTQAGLLVALLALLSLAANAPAQTIGSVTVALGEGTTNVGDTVEIPVFLTSGNDQPSVLILFIEYDPAKLAPFPDFYEFTFTDLAGNPALDNDGNTITLTSAVRPEPALEDLGKVVETGVLPDGVQTGNLPNGVFSIGVLGFDPRQQPIPNGQILTIAFQVLEAAQPNDTLILRGIGADDPILVEGENGAGVPTTEEAFSTASTSAAQRLTVNLVDGTVQIGCDAAETPSNVAATQNRSDGVLVTWSAVADPVGDPEYRVYRSQQSADVNTAVPIGEGWQTGLSFLDITAAVPVAIGQGGCAGTQNFVVTEYYYWVKARTAVIGCESEFQALGARGFRVLAKLRAPASVLPPADTLLAILLACVFVIARRPKPKPNNQQPTTSNQ